MTRQGFATSAAVGLATFFTLAPNGVQAQSVFTPAAPPSISPYSRPALSPYLNLLRSGDPAANYYMGVLPEYDRRFLQMRTVLPAEPPRLDVYVDDRADLDVLQRQLPPTGHPAGFLIYNSYFNVPNQRSYLPYNPGGTQRLRP